MKKEHVNEKLAECKKDVIAFIKNNITTKNLASYLKYIKNDCDMIDIIKQYTSFLPNDTDLLVRIHYIMFDVKNTIYCPCGCGSVMDANGRKKYATHSCYTKIPKSQEMRHAMSERAKQIYARRTEEEKKLIKEKIEKTNLLRYGNVCSLNGKEQIEKKKKTWIEHYGVDNPNKSEVIRKKSVKTNLLRYGNVTPLHNKEIEDNIKKHNLAKWGHQYAFCSKKIKEQIKEKYIEKYGVPHHMNIDEVKIKVIENGWKSGHRYKIYKTKGGKEFLCQGYENGALENYLLKKYNEDDIINDIKFMNSLCLFYFYDNKQHRYVPDLYVISKDLIVEVKSVYYFNKDLEIIMLKAKSVIESGHNFLLLLSNDGIKFKELNYEDIESYFKKTN